MAILSDNQINAYIDKLLNFVESLPMGDNGKAYIRAKIIVDFLDTWQFDDEANGFTFEEYIANPSNPRFTDVQTTYGIRNTTQIERWTEGFKTALKKSRGMALDKQLKELDKLHPALKAARLSKSLAAITRAELFEKHGIQSIKDPEWNNQLKEILGAEINFSKEQADLLTKAPNPHQQAQANDEEVLIVEELENRLAIEAVEYKRRIDDLWETHKFDPTYFDSFISGTLLNEFSKSVYDRIRPLNNQEINRYLSLSLQQFKTHTPPKRHKAFLLNYHNTYWFPNVMEYKENEYDAKYATHVWKHYTNHFHLFKEAIQKVYDDFKAGLAGTSETTKPTIAEENLRIFLKDLEYNYRLENAPISAYHQWKYNLSYLKKEVLSNLIHLEQTARKPYISSVRFQLEELLTHSQITKVELETLYLKHDTTEEQLLRNRSYTNDLHIAINDEPPKFRDTFEEGFNPDTENIQFTFYNYHYGEIIREAIKFLSEQAFEFGFGTKEETPQTPIKTKPSALSFNYIDNAKGYQNITFLMDSLKRNALIHQETKIGNFRSVFSDRKVEQKIIWTGNISELAHFIKTLHNTAKKVEDTKQKQWGITINCFQMADGSELSQDKLRTQKKPASAAIIEKAVNIL